MDFPHLTLLPLIIAFRFFWGKGLDCWGFILLFFHYLSPWLAIFRISMKENYSVILTWPSSFNEPGKFIYPEISVIPFDCVRLPKGDQRQNLLSHAPSPICAPGKGITVVRNRYCICSRRLGLLTLDFTFLYFPLLLQGCWIVCWSGSGER